MNKEECQVSDIFDVLMLRWWSLIILVNGIGSDTMMFDFFSVFFVFFVFFLLVFLCFSFDFFVGCIVFHVILATMS